MKKKFHWASLTLLVCVVGAVTVHPLTAAYADGFSDSPQVQGTDYYGSLGYIYSYDGGYDAYIADSNQQPQPPQVTIQNGDVNPGQFSQAQVEMLVQQPQANYPGSMGSGVGAPSIGGITTQIGYMIHYDKQGENVNNGYGFVFAQNRNTYLSVLSGVSQSVDPGYYNYVETPGFMPVSTIAKVGGSPTATAFNVTDIQIAAGARYEGDKLVRDSNAVDGWDMVSYFMTSPRPWANLIPPASATAGDTVTLTLHAWDATWYTGHHHVYIYATAPDGTTYPVTGTGTDMRQMTQFAGGNSSTSGTYTDPKEPQFQDNTDSIRWTIPSTAPGGTYTFHVFVRDELGRAAANFGATITMSVKAQQTPSVTLSATPTGSQPVGSSVKLTAATSNITSDDVITIKEVNAQYPGTFPSGNSYYSWASPGTYASYDFNQSVISSHGQSVTYQATIYDPDTNTTYKSNTVTVSWVNTPSVTLSVTPTGSQPAGSSFKLTAATSNITSDDVITIKETQATYPGTFPNSHTYYSWASPGNYSAYNFSQNVTSAKGQTVTYQATVYDPDSNTTYKSNTVTVSWVNTPSVTLSVTPTSPQTVGSQFKLTAATTNISSDDLVTIKEVNASYPGTFSGATSYTWTSPGNYASYNFNQNVTSSGAQIVTYVAVIKDASTGQTIDTSNTISVQWKAPAPAPSVTLSVTPTTSQATGSTFKLTAATSNITDYDTVTIKEVSAPYPGTFSGRTSYTWSSPGNYSSYNFNYNVSSSQPQTVTYEAIITDTNTGQTYTSNTVAVQWTALTPTITMSPASDQSLTTGQFEVFSYATTHWASGDYVVITAHATNAASTWVATHDTSSTDSYVEVESPENGQTTTVQYTAVLYNSAGTQLASATSGTVTWTSPTPGITLTATPTSMGPGQQTQITYNVTNMQPGDYVQVWPTGSGAHPWTVINSTSPVGSGTETEYPGQGQTITETYTAWLFNSSGNGVASAKVTVTWTNNWTGGISLSASPQLLATGQSTTLTATTSQPLPSGYFVAIEDLTTGQIVGIGTSSPFTTSYSTYSAETDQFEAFVAAGSLNPDGPPSNIVSVQWVSVSLTGSPTTLPVNNTATLTATARNMPSNYYLIIYNQTTGQVVGSTMTSSLNVSQTQSTAQTDSYEALISSTPSPTNAFVGSNNVLIDWFSVSLTASPTSLPTGQATTLTATAQNLPSGDALYIVNKTTGQIIATGQQGATTLQITDTKPDVETDQYYAEIGVPSETGTVYVADNEYKYQFGSGSYQFTGGIFSVQDTPQHDLSSASQWTNLGNPTGVTTSSTWYPPKWIYSLGYDANTNTLYAGVVSLQPQSQASGSRYNITGGQVYYLTLGSGSTTWQPVSSLSGIATYMVYDQVSRKFFIALSPVFDTQLGGPGAYGSLYVASPSTPGQFTLVSGSQNRVPNNMLTVDPSTGDIWAACGTDITNQQWGYSIFDPNGNYLTNYSPTGPGWMQAELFYDAQRGTFITAGAQSGSDGEVLFINPSNPQSTSVYANYWSGPIIFNPGGGTGQNEATNGSTTVYTDDDGITYEQGGSYTMINNGYLTTGVVPYGAGFLVSAAQHNPEVMQSTAGNLSLPTGLYLWNPSSPHTYSWVPDPAGGGSGYAQPYAIIRVDKAGPPTNIVATSNIVTVNWYQWQISLSASPTSLPVGQPTTLTASSASEPSGAAIDIRDLTTGQDLGESVAGATSFTVTFAETNPTTDTFEAYLVNPSNGSQYTGSNQVSVTWQPAPLTLSNAEVTHTAHWLANIAHYNADNPNTPRSLSEFWAGEEFVFQVQPSVTNIAQAQVTINGLTYDVYAPLGSPSSITVPLTFNPSTDLLTGHSDPDLENSFQYLLPGTYTATFWVKTMDNQVATATATFQINGKWTDYWKISQVY
ncbi:MAG: hypothetical protein K6T83_00190 [Alicyclobacillus sp.]|nr:hypothetical protein [Alicyclobacillus sp.]